jgi:ribosomal protein S18 acetylase RimI-like enzyme
MASRGNTTDSPDEARIRLANDSDLIAIVALTEEAYEPYTKLFGAPPLPVTEDYRPHIANGGAWLLELGATLAGVIILETEADHMLIFSVAVAPEFQGRGFGIRLLEWAEIQARKAGFHELRLFTNSRMERNIALYKSFGYDEIGRRPNLKRLGWTLVDMAKKLSLPAS